MAPKFISDPELAKSPVIVVGQWEKAPFQPHHREEIRDGTKVLTAIESFTEFKVLRVIRGELQPGVHKLMVGWGISWSPNGNQVSSGTSTYVPASVASVAEPVIWFLKRERSSDEQDPTAYLSVRNYRAVQSVTLEKYFAALSAEKPADEIARLLDSEDPEVLERALSLVAGESWPWPIGSTTDDFIRGQRTRDPIVGDQTAAVKALIERPKVGVARSFAVAVYADLAGKDSVPFLRGLLHDADKDVRSVTAALLLKFRDAVSIGPIVEAISGKEHGTLARAIIAEVAQWKKLQLAPALIAYLEHDNVPGQSLEHIPAQQARTALHKLTGRWFPHNVDIGRAAWKRASAGKNDAAILKLLAKELKDEELPVKAELGGDGSETARCKITNISRSPVTLTKIPDGIDQSSECGSSYRALGKIEIVEKASFVTLKPGETTTFEVKLEESLLRGAPATRKVEFPYAKTGQEWQLQAWIGVLKASFGKDWKEERKIEAVELLWPNGNLKAKGKNLNGKKSWEWQYFNVYGDRIRIENHSRGGVTECDPDHPNNHGAGKREKK